MSEDMDTTANRKEVRSFRNNRINSKKFALYVAIASIVMMFTGLTSAYIVRQAAGNWLEFVLPDIFYANTGVILASSITLHLSFLAFKRQKENAYKVLLVTTFLLGLTFLALQYVGWETMQSIGAGLTSNPSASFVYVISGLHAAHILGGVAALVVALIHAFGLDFKPTPRRKLRFEITLIYWHFVDLLWIYLVVFFTYQNV